MPRERTLAPGFFTNHLLANCQPLTRLLFQGIWTLADFDGCFEWDPSALAMKLLPRDVFDPEEAMARLELDGFIRSYEVDGKGFGFVVNWHKYQDPHPGERPIHPRPTAAPNFQVKIKAIKYRKEGDLGFDRPDIEMGVFSPQQVASKLLTTAQQVASKAFPSFPSLPALPSDPSIPTQVGRVGSGSPSSSGDSNPGGGMASAEQEAIPEDVVRIMDRWDSICIPGFPFPKVTRRHDPLLISRVQACLANSGWEGRFEVVISGIPHLPFYKGEVPPTGDYKAPFVARFKWLVSEPSVVNFHSERVADQLNDLQRVQAAQAGANPNPIPTTLLSDSRLGSQAHQLRETTARKAAERKAAREKTREVKQ